MGILVYPGVKGVLSLQVGLLTELDLDRAVGAAEHLPFLLSTALLSSAAQSSLVNHLFVLKDMLVEMLVFLENYLVPSQGELP